MATRFTAALAALTFSFGCGASPKTVSPAPVPPAEHAPISPAPAPPAAPEPTPIDQSAVAKVVLKGDATVSVSGASFTARISSAGHKIQAPLVEVSVMFERAAPSSGQAEVTWRIESGVIDGVWRPIAGRRYDQASGAYVEEAILGWEARLDSVDDTKSGGDPSAITLSVRRTP